MLSLARGHVDKLVTGLSPLPHREHGTGRRQTCDRQTHFGVNYKHFFLIPFTGTKEQTSLLCDAPSVY